MTRTTRMRLLGWLAATGLALVGSGLTVLTGSVPVEATAHCTSFTAYFDSGGNHAFIPSIGVDTHQIDCLLSQPDSNSAVTALQQTLDKCYGAGLVEDSKYGSLTAAAVRNAQRIGHVTQDGVYGPQTRNVMSWWWWNTSGGGSCGPLPRPTLG